MLYSFHGLDGKSGVEIVAFLIAESVVTLIVCAVVASMFGLMTLIGNKVSELPVSDRDNLAIGILVVFMVIAFTAISFGLLMLGTAPR